ncbi:glycosyltransferase family 4 protein [Nonlabens sp.]|uniref:glycosyltransferase family 4 protein n=1 Tax=Nonlabens sp. TaxID=1888209 RepID=UPI003F697468
MRVIQIIDSLDAGGAERMAVQIANELLAAGHESHLCTTRREGSLRPTIDEKVGYIFLEKKGKLGIKAMTKLKTYVVKNNIEIIHAHSTSFFTATVIKWWLPSIKLVWHDHYGNAEAVADRNARVLKKCSRFFNGIISVNETLKTWAQEQLKSVSVIYLRNFVSIQKDQQLHVALPGIEGKRIVHLANLRPQKDHFTLLKAFKIVQKSYPDWSLLLVGKDFEDDYSRNIESTIQEENLYNHVHLLGSRSDTAAILCNTDIAVLSSISEGLPVALLEYGMARLPVIATEVGACKEVLAGHGITVAPAHTNELAAAIIDYIENPNQAKMMAASFQNHVITTFGAHSYIKELEKFYSTL